MSRQYNNTSSAPATPSCLTNHEIYRDELRLLGHGFPLWDPVLGNTYRRVEVGDVGVLRDNSYFERLFNILLAPDDPSHTDGVPEGFQRVVLQEPAVYGRELSSGILASRGVLVTGGGPVDGGVPSDGDSVIAVCTRPEGASVILPQGASGEDVNDEEIFLDYIVANCDSWLAFTESKGFGVDMKDILLVTGRDLTSSWTPVVFTPHITKIKLSMAARSPSLLKIHGPRQSSSATEYAEDNKNQCVFLRGFRAKRRKPFQFGKLLNFGQDSEDESPSGSSAPDSAVAVLDYILGASLTQKITRIARWEPAVDIAIFYEGPQSYPTFGEDQSPGYESVCRMLSRLKPVIRILDEEKRGS
ncbi:hypothetical protein EWM64_g9674 [Hericium alpestre]|uniref:Uncharacterized protein n=1 Tax=Hericium alpestre TaxID=135208 RepID=A0A4Y9ZLN6_9AGAM|nr:hypothetical protein EWM64_g9674 [Hericium alpestre]